MTSKYRLLSPRYIYTILLLLAATAVLCMLYPKNASASFGLPDKQGYFYNRFDDAGDFVFSGGLYTNDINTFVNTISANLTDARNNKGAAFIILTMLGYPPATNPSVANAEFARWENLVRKYDSAGRVNYNVLQTYNSNTYYQDGNDDIGAYSSIGSSFSIVFTRPDGSVYKIKRDCGNPLDDIRQLPALESTVKGFRVGPGNVSLGPNGSTTLGGIGPTSSNPYIFNNVPLGVRGFSSSSIIDIGVDLYRLIGFSLCYNNSSCHGSVTIAGTSTTVDPPAGGYADIWSHYEKDDPPTATGPLTVDCNTVSGKFRDPNNPGASSKVRLYIDGVLVSENTFASDPATFSFSIGSYRSLTGRNVRIDVESVWSDGSGTGRFYSVGSGVLSSSCVSVTCGGYNPVGNQEVGVPFNLQVQVNINSLGANASPVSQAAGYRINIRVVKPDGSVINYADVNYTGAPPPSGNIVLSATQNNVMFSEAGNYIVTWQFVGGSPLLPLNCTPVNMPVISKPYALVHGNDVVAGGRIDVNPALCNSSPSIPKNIIGFTKPSPLSGSGVQYAAMAMGSITGFNSANLRTTAPTSPSGLTLANTGPGSPGNFPHTRCLPDYFSGELNDPAVSVGRTVGNVTITTNQTIGPAGVGYLIVDGDLFIHKNVTQLNGVFIARNIYTCVDNAGPYPGNLVALDRLYQQCNRQLVVSGSLIAVGDLYLLRTHGSLVDAVSQERTGVPVRSCSNGTPKDVCAAEYIIFNPALYTAPGPIKRPVGTGYDSVLSLPPVL